MEIVAVIFSHYLSLFLNGQKSYEEESERVKTVFVLIVEPGPSRFGSRIATFVLCSDIIYMYTWGYIYLRSTELSESWFLQYNCLAIFSKEESF
jgi:hypothetical protein